MSSSRRLDSTVQIYGNSATVSPDNTEIYDNLAEDHLCSLAA